MFLMSRELNGVLCNIGFMDINDSVQTKQHVFGKSIVLILLKHPSRFTIKLFCII